MTDQIPTSVRDLTGALYHEGLLPDGRLGPEAVEARDWMEQRGWLSRVNDVNVLEVTPQLVVRRLAELETTPQDPSHE